MDFDLTLILSLVAIVLILIILLASLATTLYKNKGQTETAEQNQQRVENRRQQQPNVIGGRRRNLNVRQRRRGSDEDVGIEAISDERQAIATENRRLAPAAGDGDSAEESGDELKALDGQKLGKKKLAKLQAKAEKKQQREAELQERERRKQLEAEREKEQKTRELAEEEAEKKREEEARHLQELKEKRELEEYLKLKEAFSIEEEGCDANPEAEAANLLEEFINYIKQVKIASIDELAAKFLLKSQTVVDRIKALVADRTLTGVIDDRGKFIYITEDELAAVAKFINRCGRVSVTELADYSNKLIRL